MSHEDIELICNAYQLASRKGANVLLVVAGLPGSFEKISKYEGCTYMRRAAHVRLGLFTYEETVGALGGAIGSIDLLECSDDVIGFSANLCKGQPYLMQLFGFHLVELANASLLGKRNEIGREPYEVLREDAQRAFYNALPDYREGVLKPILDETPAAEMRYLRAAAAVLDDDRVATSEKIARELAVERPNELSSSRRKLIEKELIVPAGHGKVAFAVPYLADYLAEEAQNEKVLETALGWRL